MKLVSILTFSAPALTARSHHPKKSAASASSAVKNQWFQFAVSVSVLCLGLLTTSHAATKTLRPNIIFILADDLGYGDLGCYNQDRIKTPHLDRMAAEGMRFTNAYAGFNVCAPSRSVLMTGQHTGHTRVRSNGSGPLLPEDVTVAELLKEVGYRTALIGKWGLGKEGTTGAPWNQGFDHFFGYLDQGHAHNFYPEFLWRNQEEVTLRNEVVPSSKYGGLSGVATVRVDYSHDLMATEALVFIDENKSNRFFLYLAFTIPHANNQAQMRPQKPAPGEAKKSGSSSSPAEASREGRVTLEGDPGWKVIPEQLAYHRERQGMEVPDAGQYQDTDWPGPQKGTAAMITRMDGDIGRIFEKLAEYGIDEHTLVFFSSDNGPHQEGGNDPYFFQSMGPLQGYKRSWHDGGIRVPMIVRWPGKIDAATESDLPWYFADFLPTVTDLLDIETPENIDGVSVLPALLGKAQDELSERYLYWGYAGENPGDVQAGAVRIGNWKAVIENNEIALYDVSTDLAEKTDVAAQQPEVVEGIREFLKGAVEPAGK